MPAREDTMPSRQRVLAALNHQQPDRVPIDLGGNQTGIHKGAYQALIEQLGLSEEIDIMDAVQQLAEPCEAPATPSAPSSTSVMSCEVSTLPPTTAAG